MPYRLLTFIFLVGWSVTGSSSVSDRIRVGLPAFPHSLFHYLADDEPSLAVNTYIFESLIALDTTTGEWYPRLAERWEWSADKKALTFTLRKEAKFSDGKPVTAQDVVFTCEAIRNPKHLTAPFRSGLEMFKTIQAVNSRTVRFESETAQYQALQRAGSLFVLPQHVWKGIDFNRAPERALVGSGPYRFVSQRRGDHILLKRNPQYWGSSLPQHREAFRIDTIEFRAVPDPTLGLGLLKKKNLDFLYVTLAKTWAVDLNPASLPKNVHRLEVETKLPFGTQAIFWNLRRPLFRDPRIRQALAHLVPRQTLIDSLFYRQYSLSSGVVHGSSSFHHPDNLPLPYSTKRAATLFREAGCVTAATGKLLCRGVPMRFSVVSATPGAERYLTVYREELRRAGIELELKIVDWDKLLQIVDARDFDAVEMTRSRQIDPTEFAIDWSSQGAKQKGSANFTGLSNSQIDRLAAKIATIFDRKQRIAAIRELDLTLARQYPAAFLWEPHQIRIAYGDGFTFKGPGYAPFDRWYQVFSRWAPAKATVP